MIKKLEEPNPDSPPVLHRLASMPILQLEMETGEAVRDRVIVIGGLLLDLWRRAATLASRTQGTTGRELTVSERTQKGGSSCALGLGIDVLGRAAGVAGAGGPRGGEFIPMHDLAR